MFSRTAVLLCVALLMGCQNASQQFSLYAPFGPAVVPTPALTRANPAAYYPASKNSQPAATTPASTTASTADNKLSHFDPYRGILLPGGFQPGPVAARTDETWGNNDTQVATAPRERPSTEEPIRIVESTNPASPVTAIASRRSNTQSGAVKFNASPPSGSVQPSAIITATEVARMPKPPASTAAPGTKPLGTPEANPAPAAPGLITPPPAAPKPAEPRRLSLWNDPRDGSRVQPANHTEYARPANSGAWRVRD